MPESMRTVMVTVWLPTSSPPLAFTVPDMTVPTFQTTVLPVGVAPDEALTKLVLTGMVSEMTTPVAFALPMFLTVIK